MSENSQIRLGASIAMLVVLAVIKFLAQDLAGNPLLFSFAYIGLRIPFALGFYITATLLALAAYLFAVDVVSRKSRQGLRQLGNAAYALAMLVPLIFVGMFVIGFLQYAVSNWSRSLAVGTATAVSLSVLVLCTSIAFVVHLWLQLGSEDERRALEGLNAEQTDALARAQGLLEAGLYDLMTIECFRGVESAIKRGLLNQRRYGRSLPIAQLIETAEEAGILEGSLRQEVHDLRVLRNAVLHENRPVDRPLAERTMDQTRTIITRLSKDDARQSESAPEPVAR